MLQANPLIATFVMSLVLAFIGGMAAKKLRLPPLVGYLAAGIVISPFTPGLVAHTHIARQLAEVGVILLLFGVGLHFSIRDLWAVRHVAIPGAIGRIAVTTAVCIGMTTLWGWSFGAGLVFGLALSVSSTVVLLRALEERNALDTETGRIAIGWLIVEDLVMVFALVLLPALTVPLGGEPGDAAAASGPLINTIALTLAKLALFVVVVLFGGRWFVPWVLGHVARTGSRELFTLAVLAVALGLAYGSAMLFGVSFALGAFFAGLILSESDLSHRAAAQSLPLQDAFAVLFFVSVGMLFDPSILVREPWRVAAVVAIVIVGKSLITFSTLSVLRYPLATALRVSVGLAQIAEFSFILAGLGMTLGLLQPEARDLILAGAIVSIMLNPLMFASSRLFTKWLDARPQLQARLERSGHPLATLAEDTEHHVQGHAIIVGYGRVGSAIGRIFWEQALPFTVIDLDRRRVERLRQQGVSAIYGNGAAPGVLEAAGVQRAHLLVLASPPGHQVTRIIEQARGANADIDTLVRSHNANELTRLKKQGVGLAMVGARELALGMMDYGLRSMGLPDDKVHTIVSHARTSGAGSAFEQATAVADEQQTQGAPELRSHDEDDV